MSAPVGSVSRIEPCQLCQLVSVPAGIADRAVKLGVEATRLGNALPAHTASEPIHSEVVSAPLSARDTTFSALPPVSATLDAELRRVIKERGIVVWLDADASYDGFVAALEQRAAMGAFPFPVLRFEGSFLQLMLALGPYGNGLHPEKVLVHLPGYNKEASQHDFVAQR